jgi:hypothetical protein
MPASEIVATVVFAALVFRYMPAKVSARVLVGLAGSAVFTVMFVWLDLDKIAGIFGSLAALSALYGIPFFMRDSILAHPPFRALVWGASKESELEVRQAIVAGAAMLIAALLGAFVMDAANDVFQLSESLIDKAEHSPQGAD